MANLTITLELRPVVMSDVNMKPKMSPCSWRVHTTANYALLFAPLPDEHLLRFLRCKELGHIMACSCFFNGKKLEHA